MHGMIGYILYSREELRLFLLHKNAGKPSQYRNTYPQTPVLLERTDRRDTQNRNPCSGRLRDNLDTNGLGLRYDTLAQALQTQPR